MHLLLVRTVEGQLAICFQYFQPNSEFWSIKKNNLISIKLFKNPEQKNLSIYSCEFHE